MNTRFLKVFVLTSLMLCLLKPANSEPNTSESYNPKPASASLYNLGLRSYENGDLNSAVTYFQRAIDLDTNFTDAYFNLGAIYKKLRKYPQAVYSFQKVAEIDPKDYEATYELATCHLALNNYAYASKYFSVIPPSSPAYNEARANLDKINNLALEGTGNPVITGSVGSPENQAKLLVNVLTKEEDKPDITAHAEAGFNQPSSNDSQSELLVNTLTKPRDSDFEKDNLNIVSDGFSGPTGIAKDTKGNIYIANFSTDSIERVAPDGKKEIFIDKVGIAGPVGLAFDNEDNLYVANYRGGSVVKISQNKDVSVVISELNKPYYLYFDTATEKLLITEQGKNSLIEVDTGTVSSHPITKN